ncbi:MAG: TlpA family protein disulfide reductase [Syntrophobacterales bacterium]|nr:MAG: TlpA family protein disulfide reductase [Syntrophobacterales bacterium]
MPILFLILLFMVIVVPVSAFSAQERGLWTPSIEEPAPDFVLKDLNGSEVSLDDYKGKVVLLAFSTTWCPHCRKMPPYLNELRSSYGDKGLVILNIDIQEPQKKVRSYAEKQNIQYTVLLDEDGAVATAYQVRGVPSLILVDKKGTIVCRQCRSLDVLLEELFPVNGAEDR